MKYTIQRVKANEVFKPFSVTLTFETHDEYVHFHDNVLETLVKGTSHKLVGDVFSVGTNRANTASGEI